MEEAETEKEEKERTIGVILDECIGDALTRLIQPPQKIPVSLLVHYSWPQGWPDQSCGHGQLMVREIGDDTVYLAPTIVIGTYRGIDLCVYHGGKFAYYIKTPNDLFMQSLTNRRLMGAWEYSLKSKPYDSAIIRANAISDGPNLN